MRFVSTRGKAEPVSAANAILYGLAPDGGLYCPEVFPSLSFDRLLALSQMPYSRRAAEILALFLPDFTLSELEAAADVYGDDTLWTGGNPAPVTRLDDKIALLELWHGPTCAFKDMALQILPGLMSLSAKKLSDNRKFCILTATSGDTGKAALEGFRDRPGFSVLVFYPENGVSNAQKLQMVTQDGKNVGVCAIKGSFDDAQSGVKDIFSDKEFADGLLRKNITLSSANSINLGRLLPQVAYYVSAYCDMLTSGMLKMGQKLDVTVPTGNFGNILAAYYAKTIGLPLGSLICASNDNNVLYDFLRSGIYDRRRELLVTSSPSMDILVSSNFERALFHLSGGDSGLVGSLMAKLTKDGVYTAPDTLRKAFDAHFTGGWCDGKRTAASIKREWNENRVLLDPHTAVAVTVARESLSENPMLIASTASPYKFREAVGSALGIYVDVDEFTGIAPPEPLNNLDKKMVRFTESVTKPEMKNWISDFLNNM